MPEPGPQSVEWFATLGVGGVVAAFMFMFYRRDVKQYTELWQKQSEQNALVLKQVIEVIRDNTVALTKVVTTVDSLHRRLDGTHAFPQREPRRERD